MRLALAASALLLPACAASVRPPDAVVHLTAPAGAQLYVDDRPVAHVGPHGTVALGLAAGAHRLELRADGRLPAYRELTVARGDQTRMHVSLRPDLDGDPPAPGPLDGARP